MFQYLGETPKTDQSAVTKLLSFCVEHLLPTRVNVDLIDELLCNTIASEVHIILDQFLNSPEKYIEGYNHNEIHTQYTILQLSQKMSTIFKSFKK